MFSVFGERDSSAAFILRHHKSAEEVPYAIARSN